MSPRHRPPPKAPPRLVGLAPAKREEPPGPLKTHEPLKPREKPAKAPPKPMKKRNDARMEERNEAAFGPSANMARLLPCVRCNRPPPSDPAHVVSRGAGGLDRDNIVSLCKGPMGCHAYQHQIGIKDFERKTGLDLTTLAKETTAKADAHACSDYPDEAEKYCLICEERIDGKGGVR